MTGRPRLLLLAALLAAPACTDDRGSDPPSTHKRVVVVTQTAGFRHTSIATAVALIQRLGRESGAWEVTTVANTAEEVAAVITGAGLAETDLVIFANTTGDLAVTASGREAFYAWIRAGGGFLGLHSASDTFHGDSLYAQLLGGEFSTHGPQVTVTIHVDDRLHPSTRELPEHFDLHEEIYEFVNWSRTNLHMLLALRKHPQSGVAGDYPLAWTRRHKAGRVFYTSLGHREDTYSNAHFQSHLAGGIRWALGLASGDDTLGNRQP